METVALVTYSKQPNLFDGDNLLVEPFKKHGFKAFAIPWDKKGVTWKDFNLVILRSTWDYHYRIPEFTAWLDRFESQNINLWNPLNIIRWNMNKKYLLDLENAGVPIIPTLLLNKETVGEAKKIVRKNDWKEVVVKPVYGTSSYKIVKVKAQELDTFQDNEVIIQPFMKEVNLEGEYSFIFFNKQYSHTVLKKPKKNEFRSQREFEGKELKIIPSQQLISQAKQVLDKIKSPLLYARIDGLVIDGQLQLMELELIEPYLFFEKEKNSAEKFVEVAINLGRIF